MTDPLVVNPDIELPQLDISNNYTTDCTIEYSTGNFTCIQIVFNLRRRLGYHLFHTYIPSALIVVMSWIAFWIKPEAIPARVTLGVTSLLTLGNITFTYSPELYVYRYHRSAYNQTWISYNWQDYVPLILHANFIQPRMINT